MTATHSPTKGRVSLPAGPPRGDMFRALAPGPELREGDKQIMVGRFAEFETWTEVNSVLEGHFMERVAPTAFRKTVRENRQNMRCLFHHGRDVTGMQVLGTILELDEDSSHEVELFDSVPALIMDGLRARQYGSSYRFSIVDYEFQRTPRRSAHNPDGIPELTILEARVREFGPTPLPVYAGTSSGIRSLTDEYFVDQLADDPDRLEEMLRGRSQISVPRDAAHRMLEQVERELRRDDDALDGFHYKRSVEAVGAAVWTIHPSALETIVGIIGERANGHRPTAEEIRERIGTRAEPQDAPSGPVAVIRVDGMIVPRADLMSEMSGATSIESLQQQFRAALNDPEVSAILFDVDSPGGDARMVPELGAEIRAARGTKPIVAVANTMAASGAYWLASQADEVVVSPSGDVGSIGAYTVHTDLSAAQEKAGIKTTLVSAGEYKVERNPFQPLSEEAQAEMQARIDEIYGTFVDAVAAGRGVDRETVLEKFGQGRMVMAAAAVKAGMADRVATFDETLARLQKQAAAGVKTRSEPEPDEATTRTEGEPESSVTTTRSSRDLFWFVEKPEYLKGNE